MENEDAATLVAITGMPMEKSLEFLRCFGSLESASNAFFDGRAPSAVAPAVIAAPFDPFPGYEVIWGCKERPPESWMDQEIKLINLGIVQEKNGPCGVLVAVNAVLVAQCLEREGELDKKRVFSAEEFVDALAAIVERCNENATVHVASWTNEVGDDVTFTEMNKGEEIRSFMLEHLSMYIGRGCLLLLIYSAVFSRGLDRVKSEIAEGGDGSLVVKPFWLCTSELVMLLIVGRADGRVSAYDHEGKKVHFPTCQVGLLSFAEVETGIPICDELKSPVNPVWIVHGGDHFTLLMAEKHPPADPDVWFELMFWNALPPGRTFQTLKVYSETGPCPPAPNKLKRKWFKPRAGEIDEVIQAHPEDREKTEYFSRWRYEVILACDDPSVKGKDRPVEMQKDYPIFELEHPPDGEWRCACCYRQRFKSMCFGMNKAGATNCEHCGKHILEAGWTVYMHYKELPKPVRKIIQKNFGAKILNVIRTKWPDCELTYEDEDDIPSC